MSGKDHIELTGIVTKQIRGAKYEVTVEREGFEPIVVTCSQSGKIRMNKIKIVTGDKVDINVSPYDLTQGMITWRHPN